MICFYLCCQFMPNPYLISFNSYVRHLQDNPPDSGPIVCVNDCLQRLADKYLQYEKDGLITPHERYLLMRTIKKIDMSNRSQDIHMADQLVDDIYMHFLKYRYL